MAGLSADHEQNDAPALTRTVLPNVTVSDEIAARLDELLDLVLRWNSRINLISRGVRAALHKRHVVDSLQLLGLLPAGDDPIGDLGSGGGFPGLVLALAAERPTHLVEADKRKAAFLEDAAARLGARTVTVHPMRMEAAQLPPLAALTARALAPLPSLMPHAYRLLAPTGVAIFPKGRSAADELAAARLAWAATVETFRSGTDPDATIYRLRDIRPATHA